MTLRPSGSHRGQDTATLRVAPRSRHCVPPGRTAARSRPRPERSAFVAPTRRPPAPLGATTRPYLGWRGFVGTPWDGGFTGGPAVASETFDPALVWGGSSTAGAAGSPPDGWAPSRRAVSR